MASAKWPNDAACKGKSEISVATCALGSYTENNCTFIHKPMLSDAQKQQIKAIHQSIKLALPGYQARPSQNKLVAEMANIIAGSYHSYDRIGLIEAGTGTGKSLAYLLAAVPLALHYKKKLVIATATVALQEQLVNKDLPFFQEHSKLPFEFSLVKGRQRYVCAQRLQQQVVQPDLLSSFEKVQAAAELPALAQAWRERRWLGDKDTLPEALSETVWQSIQADPYHCPKGQSAHAGCPFHLARAEVDSSQVLVVNHALLLADLASGNSILPEPSECIYVIDEAHHLPDVGRDFFAGSALLNFDLKPWQDRLQKLHQQLQKLLPQHSAIRDTLKLQDLTADFYAQLKPVQTLIAKNPQWFEKANTWRFIDAQLPELISRQAEPLTELSGKILQSIEKLFQALLEQLNDGKLRSASLTPLQQELSALEAKFAAQNQLWQAWTVPQQPHVSQARWLDHQETGIIGHACPLSVNFQLDDLLFSKAYAALLCSATLSSLNSFDGIKRELGLNDHPGVRTLQVASPFAYAERGLIHIPKLAFEPTAEQFTAELIQVLPNYLDKSAGNLVLFASYWQMEEVATALRKQGWSLLVQGEAGRQSLLDLHQMRIDGGEGSILFGTQSFSEGLDLPGALLTNLIITKLPFAVPTSPFEEAMAEAVTKRGGNPFLLLTVPATARKLVQACGRLLRKEQDFGRIVILDRRLVTKSYGKAMLAALPPFQRQIDG